MERSKIINQMIASSPWMGSHMRGSSIITWHSIRRQLLSIATIKYSQFHLESVILLEVMTSAAAAGASKSPKCQRKLVLEQLCSWCRRRVCRFYSSFWPSSTFRYICFITRHIQLPTRWPRLKITSMPSPWATSENQTTLALPSTGLIQ